MNSLTFTFFISTTFELTFGWKCNYMQRKTFRKITESFSKSPIDSRACFRHGHKLACRISVSRHFWEVGWHVVEGIMFIPSSTWKQVSGSHTTLGSWVIKRGVLCMLCGPEHCWDEDAFYSTVNSWFSRKWGITVCYKDSNGKMPDLLR